MNLLTMTLELIAIGTVVVLIGLLVHKVTQRIVGESVVEKKPEPVRTEPKPKKKTIKKKKAKTKPKSDSKVSKPKSKQTTK